MKKLMLGLGVVILMGTAVSSLERFTGVNLYLFSRGASSINKAKAGTRYKVA